jgi:hypothetical protein
VSRIVELVFTGENRSAVKAMKGIADQSDETTAAVKGGADEQTAAMAKVKESTLGLREAFSSLAGVVGIAGVAFGLKDLVEGGMNLQSAQTNLRASLKETGETAAGVYAQMNKAATDLSTRGGFGATTSLQGMAEFTRETKSATEAVKLNALATDIARAKNLQYSDAQGIVAKAYTGQTRGLQSLLGPTVAARDATVGLTTTHARQIATLEQEASMMGKMGSVWLGQQEVNDHITAQQAAMAQLTDKHTTATRELAAATKVFGGYAERVYSKTTAGRLEAFHNGLQNLTETLGESLLPDFNKLIGVATRVADWMDRNRKLVRDLALAFAGLGAAFAVRDLVKGIRGLGRDLLGVAKAFGLVKDAEAETAVVGEASAAETGIAWDTVMTGTIAGVVIVGLLELVEHWKAVKKIAEDVWKAVEGGASDAWNWIKGHWELLASILGGPFVAAGLFIATHWHQIMRGASDVLKWIERTFSMVERAITDPFRKAFDFIKRGFGELQHVIGGVGHFLSHPFGLSTGGVVPKYLAAGGPIGSDVVPTWLTPGEGVLNTRAMSLIGGEVGLNMANSGNVGGMNNMGLGGGNITITPGQTIVKIGDREVAAAVTRYVLNRAARGPSSLSGGSLAIGAPGNAYQ